MPYTPPAGHAIHAQFPGTGYSAPTGHAIPAQWAGEGGAPLLGWVAVPGPLGVPAVLAHVGRSLVAGTGAPWAAGRAAAAELRALVPATHKGDQECRAPWPSGRPIGARSGVPWGRSRALDGDARAPWGHYARHADSAARLPWGISRPMDRDARLPWDFYAGRADRDLRLPWLRSRPTDTDTRPPWGAYALRLDLGYAAPFGAARAANLDTRVPWGRYTKQLAPGWGVVVEPGGPPVNEHGTLVVPIRRAYIVINEAYLTRDSVPIPCHTMTVAIDADSWVWQFSASLPGAAFDAVQPETDGSPAELVATINGYLFRVLVEQVARSREYGRSGVRISGRGRAAQLAAPYAPVTSRGNAEAATAQQLMDAALEFTGWTLDWQITDWLVPAGAWAHQGTPMEAVLRVAEAAGAIVQADADTQVLHILPRYPVLPWGWGTATPHIILPPDVVVTEGQVTHDKPSYNRVFVSGENVGVIGQVTRTGTAGDRVAPQVVDGLTTHADAARQRGSAILADTGRQARMSLALPLSEDTALLLPGQLAQVSDTAAWRGLVRGVSLSATWSQTLTVRQVAELERHYEEPA